MNCRHVLRVTLILFVYLSTIFIYSISSSKPGPDSMSFVDPTSVVKSVLGNQRSACDRCGQQFDHSNNGINSCSFHLGRYVNGSWTCCKYNYAHANGCKHCPHSGKERAAFIRVESLPRTVDGLSLYSHVEINLFPGIRHTLMLQISKSMSLLLKSYFFVEEDHDEDSDDMSDATGSTDSNSVQSSHASMLLSIKHKPITSSVTASSQNSRERLGSSELKMTSPENKPLKAPELVLIKVCRVGNVDVNITVGGFRRLSQISSLDICVPAYSKAYEIGSWEFHSKKYLRSHLVREVLKSGARSGFSQFRRKKFGGSAITEEPSHDNSSPTSTPPDVPPTFVHSKEVLDISKEASDILGMPAPLLKKKKKLFFGR